MKYCAKCGKQLMDEAVICPNCGCAVDDAKSNTQSDDAPNAGFAFLGFLFPLVGLIIYLCLNGSSPLKAKSAGKGALVGFIVVVFITIIISAIAEVNA